MCVIICLLSFSLHAPICLLPFADHLEPLPSPDLDFESDLVGVLGRLTVLEYLRGGADALGEEVSRVRCHVQHAEGLGCGDESAHHLRHAGSEQCERDGLAGHEEEAGAGPHGKVGNAVAVVEDGAADHRLSVAEVLRERDDDVVVKHSHSSHSYRMLRRERRVKVLSVLAAVVISVVVVVALVIIIWNFDYIKINSVSNAQNILVTHSN